MRGMGENCLIKQILPVTGELLLCGDLARDRSRTSSGTAHHDAIADSRGSRRAKRQRIEIDRAKRLHQPEPALEIEAERVTLDHASITEMQPDSIGFRD